MQRLLINGPVVVVGYEMVWIYGQTDNDMGPSHKSVAFIASCHRHKDLAAFKPAHNLSLSMAFDQNQ